MSIGIINLLKLVHIHHNHIMIHGIMLRQQVALQLVTVVESRQRVIRNQLILQSQINEQENHRTPETENRGRKREEHLRRSRNNAPRSVTRHNQVNPQILPVFSFKSTGKAANRHRHDIDKREEHLNKIEQHPNFLIFVQPEIRYNNKRRKQQDNFHINRNF